MKIIVLLLSILIKFRTELIVLLLRVVIKIDAFIDVVVNHLRGVLMLVN